MNGHADSRRKTTKALIPHLVRPALAMSLATRRLIQRENIHRALCCAMQKLFGLGVFVLGWPHLLRPKYPGEAKGFRKALDSAVLSDVPTAPEPINPRLRQRDVVLRARHSIGRPARCSRPRDEIRHVLRNALEISLLRLARISNFLLSFVLVYGVQYGKARENPAVVGSRERPHRKIHSN